MWDGFKTNWDKMKFHDERFDLFLIFKVESNQLIIFRFFRHLILYRVKLISKLKNIVANSWSEILLVIIILAIMMTVINILI